MLWLSPLLGVASGLAGLYLSYYADLAASPSIALVAIGLFVLALGVAPARRLVARPRAAATAATGA
jgi:ABC-type Mn2+/Zn2+ transport system permease subunit